MKPDAAGFTLIELMIVIAIIGIMATMAVPSYQERVIRAQVSEGLGLASFAEQAVAQYYAKTHRMPPDNLSAGLPPADRIVGTYVEQLEVRGGALKIVFGNQSNRNLAGKTLTIRPAAVPDYPQVPLSWVCGLADVPKRMVAQGNNETNLPPTYLPIDCRSIGRRS
jgi:type IV pilus assembly protein PilA